MQILLVMISFIKGNLNYPNKSDPLWKTNWLFRPKKNFWISATTDTHLSEKAIFFKCFEHDKYVYVQEIAP